MEKHYERISWSKILATKPSLNTNQYTSPQVHIDAAKAAAVGAGAGAMSGLHQCQQNKPVVRAGCIAGHTASGALIGAQTVYANHALNGGK